MAVRKIVMESSDNPKSWSNDKELTYKEAQRLALAYYNQGGDSFYECWDEKEFNEFVEIEGHPMTVGGMKSMFRMYDEVDRDMRGSGEYQEESFQSPVDAAEYYYSTSMDDREIEDDLKASGRDEKFVKDVLRHMDEIFDDEEERNRRFNESVMTEGEAPKRQYIITGVTNEGERKFYNVQHGWGSEESATLFDDRDTPYDLVIGNKIPREGFRRVFVPVYIKEGKVFESSLPTRNSVIDLDRIALDIWSMFQPEKLGEDNWIEFDYEGVQRTTSGTEILTFKAYGPEGKTVKGAMRTDGSHLFVRAEDKEVKEFFSVDDVASYIQSKFIKSECMTEGKESEEVIVGIYGDEVPGFESVDALVAHFEKKGIKVLSREGDMESGWDMTISGKPRTLFFAVVNVIPGYNSDSVQEFVDEYQIEESLKENYVRVIYKDEEFGHKQFSLTRTSLEAMKKALDQYEVSKEDIISVEGCSEEDLFESLTESENEDKISSAGAKEVVVTFTLRMEKYDNVQHAEFDFSTEVDEEGNVVLKPTDLNAHFVSAQVQKSESLTEAPDLDTTSGHNDYFSNLMHVAIDRLGLNENPVSWDVKGTKFTLRFSDKKVVVVTPSGGTKLQARVDNALSHQRKDISLSGQASRDISLIVSEIKSI